MSPAYFILAGLLAIAPQRAAHADARERAVALYYRGELTASAEAFEAAARTAPTAQNYLDAAVVYRDLSRAERSRDLFRQAARLLPKDSDVLAALGWAELRAGDSNAARAAFEDAGRNAPEHRLGLLGLAKLELDEGRPARALETLKALRAAHPDFTPAHVLAGRARKAAGQTQQAIDAYRDAHESDPTYSEVRMWLAPLYEELKAYNEAWKEYAKTLYVSPRHPEALKQYGRLAGKITAEPQEIIPPRRLKEHLPVSLARPDRRMPAMRVAVGTTITGKPAPKPAVAFIPSGPFEVRDPVAGRRLAVGSAGGAWTARRRGRGPVYELVDPSGRARVTFRHVISVRALKAGEDSMIFQRLDLARGTAWAAQGDRQLKGEVELRTFGSKGLYLVNVIGLEDYLYGVINEEMPSRFPEEALKAQAVIARNHALYSRNFLRPHRKDAYHICDGQHCQVFSGISGESARGRTAVDATRGLVLQHKGRLAQTPYSSNCGGHTQDSGEVRGWFAMPYLSGRKDDRAGSVDMKSPWELDRWLKTRPGVYCNLPEYMHSSHFRWARILPADELGRRLRRRTSRLGYLREILVLQRSASGNVNKIQFRGTRGAYTLARENSIRGVLGLGSVRSTMLLLEVDRDAKGVPTDVYVYGGGWGHGVGLCQIGAAGRALDGQDFKAILAHYFRGTYLKSLGY